MQIEHKWVTLRARATAIGEHKWLGEITKCEGRLHRTKKRVADKMQFKQRRVTLRARHQLGKAYMSS